MTSIESVLSDFYLWVGWEPNTWLALFMVATLADAGLTLYAINHGTHEANPVMARLMAILSPPVALAVMKMLHAAIVFSTLQMRILWLPVVALSFVAACLWNIGQILRARKT